MATLDQIAQSLKAADAAGDTDAAQQLAQAYRQAQVAAQNQAPTSPQAPPDYSQLHAQLSALPPEQRSAAVASLTPQDQQTLQQGQQAVAQAAMSPQAQAADYRRIQAQNVAGDSGLQNFMAGAGKSVVDTGRGIGQLVGLQSQSDIDAAQNQDAALMSTTAGKLGDVSGQIAQAAIPVGDAGKVLSFAGKAAPYLGAAIRGGMFAFSQPVQEGGSRAMNTALGAGAGAAGQGVTQGLGALASKAAPALSPIKQAAIETAQKYGIPLHLSQVTDSKALQTLASASKYLPFAGNTVARNAQQGAFNQALSNQIGESAPSLTDEVLANASQKIGQGYNDLFARNAVKLSPDDATKLTNIINAANHFGGSDVGQLVGNHVDSIVGNLDENGTMPGRLYQALRTDQLLPAEKGANPAAGYYVRQIRNVLQDAANRSMGPQDAQALAQLNGQYNSLKIISQAINKRAAGAGGDVAPANLWSLVNGKYGSTPQMRDLAQLGQTVLKDPIPDSGTAGRLMSYGALTGGAAMPHTLLVPAAAGATLGRALNSPLAARTLPYAGQNLLLGLQGASRPLPYLLPVMGINALNHALVPSVAAPQQ